MAQVAIPQNCGKVRVAIGHGNKWTVWNGKQGENEFVIIARDRKHAEELAKLINSREHDGFVEVLG